MGRAFEYRRKSKEMRWDKMSKLFPKLSKAITIAAKSGGGPDPEVNGKLRTAILNAKAENMPKDNIEAAIKRAAGKDASEITETAYGGKGPHGVLIFVECATDNTNRTVTNLNVCFNKGGGQMVPSGSLEFMFSRKAVVEFPITDGLDLEDLELNLIDAGLEELEIDKENGIAWAYADYTNFGSLTHGFEQQKVEFSKANLQRIATSPVTLTEEQMADVEKLLDRIEDDEDVQAVFTNIA